MIKFNAQFPNITIITICCHFDRTLKSGTSWAGLAGMWDSMAQIWDILGNPGQVATLLL